MNRIVMAGITAGLLLLTACGASSPSASGGQAAGGGGGGGGGGASSGGTAAAAPATFAEQVALGQTLYAQQCANCHGDAGEGSGGAPRVVGLREGALPLAPRPGSRRTTPFRTVGDVASFVVANMPPGSPGSLAPEQFWAILAFDLHANGIDLQQKLTTELAATPTIPR